MVELVGVVEVVEVNGFEWFERLTNQRSSSAPSQQTVQLDQPGW